MAESDEGRKIERKRASHFGVMEIFYILIEVLLPTVYIHQKASNSDLKRVLF